MCVPVAREAFCGISRDPWGYCRVAASTDARYAILLQRNVLFHRTKFYSLMSAKEHAASQRRLTP